MKKCYLLPLVIGLGIYVLTVTDNTAWAQETSSSTTAPAEQFTKLQEEFSLLQTRMKELEARKGIDREYLLRKKVLLLREMAKDVASQRQTVEYFQSFISWMSSNLTGYNKYLKAGSYAATVARILPIPYAGQASVFAKFAAQFTIELNNTSLALTSYLATSRKFTGMAGAIEPQQPLDASKIKDVTHLASSSLLQETHDVQNRLATVSNLSSGAISFLESLNNYLSETDEYWNKAKGIFRKDSDPKEKSFISESATALKNSAKQFNEKLVGFDDLSRKQAVRMASLTAYDELLSDLEPK